MLELLTMTHRERVRENKSHTKSEKQRQNCCKFIVILIHAYHSTYQVVFKTIDLEIVSYLFSFIENLVWDFPENAQDKAFFIRNTFSFCVLYFMVFSEFCTLKNQFFSLMTKSLNNLLSET